MNPTTRAEQAAQEPGHRTLPHQAPLAITSLDWPGAKIFHSQPEPVKDGKQDVLILSEGNPFKSHSATLENRLSKLGAKIEDDLEGMAYTARLTSDQKAALQQEG